jgi:hypothetical protein
MMRLLFQGNETAIKTFKLTCLLVLLVCPAVGAIESGVYQTLPGATMKEWGDRVPGGSRVLPLSATVTLDAVATPPRLTAFMSNAVLEGGDPTVTNLTLVLQPTLSFAPVGAGQIQISWSTNFTDYILESAASVPAVNWRTVTNLPTTNNGRLSVTVDTAASQQFFRLYKP